MAETEELKKTKASIEEMIVEKFQSVKSGGRLGLVCSPQIGNIQNCKVGLCLGDSQ